MRILMVCLGNICRSPLAHGILESKVSNRIFVDSAGTSAYHNGDLPDIRSIEVADKHKVNLRTQRSRLFVKEDFDLFDLIFVMDSSNYNNVLKLTNNKEHINKVKLIMNEVNIGENKKVPDPYYGGINGFQEVYEMLDRATDKIIENYLSYE